MVKLIVGALAALILIGGIWFALPYIKSTPIDKIINNPRDFENKEATISGTVTDRGSLMFISYFTVKDNTGEITVLSKKAMPTVGSKIRVKGRVDASFELGDMQRIVLVEK